MTDITLGVHAYIPRGSGDAEYRLVDVTSDNHDVLAIVDPHMTMDDPDGFAHRLCDAFNTKAIVVEAIEAARLFRATEPCAGNLPVHDRLIVPNGAPEFGLDTATHVYARSAALALAYDKGTAFVTAPAGFDRDGKCEFRFGSLLWTAQHSAHAIAVLDGGEDLFTLPPTFPVEMLPAAMAVFRHGQASGKISGRIEIQHGIKRLLEL